MGRKSTAARTAGGTEPETQLKHTTCLPLAARRYGIEKVPQRFELAISPALPATPNASGMNLHNRLLMPQHELKPSQKMNRTKIQDKKHTVTFNNLMRAAAASTVTRATITATRPYLNTGAKNVGTAKRTARHDKTIMPVSIPLRTVTA